MKESKAVYVTKRDLKYKKLHREYQLYTNKVITRIEGANHNVSMSKDMAVQYNSKRDNVICTCKNLSGMRRHHEARYFSTTPNLYTYKSRSYTDVGVGSIKAYQKKKVKRIYLPQTDDRGVGSADLSYYINRRPKQYKTTSFYDEKRTSSKCVGGTIDNKVERVVSAQASPIVTTKSGTTSPNEAMAFHKMKNMEIGSNTMEKELVNATTQIEQIAVRSDLKQSDYKAKTSIIKKTSILPKPEMSTPPTRMEPDRRIKEEKSFSSDSLVQHVHNLEDPSIKSCDMENKLEKEYHNIFTVKSKEKVDSVEKTMPDFKSASILRRRFEALRRGIGKRDDSKKNIDISRTPSQGSDASHRDVSITSDPPSLEERSYSNLQNTSNKYPATLPPKLHKDASYKKSSFTGKKEKRWNQPNTIDSEYAQGVKGMFKLWGKKFNLDDDERKDPTPQQSYNKDFYKGGIKISDEMSRRDDSSAPDQRAVNAPIETEDPVHYERKKEEKKKFLFFKRRTKEKEKVKEPYKPKKGVTTGRCEVRDGLVIKIGANKITPSSSYRRIERSSESSRYEEILRKSWLLRYLSSTTDSRKDVKVRWNNKTYTTSSSTVFELMENVYKESGVVFKSKSEILSDDSSYYSEKPYAKRPNVSFLQNVQAWMIPTIIDQPLARVHKKDDKKNRQVNISDHKWLIDKSKAFARKIELVLHSNNVIRLHDTKPSSQYLRIDIPKGFFSDTMSADESPIIQTSDEEVYKIVEYETPKASSDLKSFKRVCRTDSMDKGLEMTLSVRSDKVYGTKVIEKAIKRDPTQKDVVIQSSNIYIPKKCDVIGVGIITQRDIREAKKPILKILEYISDEDNSNECNIHATGKKCEFAETYLKDYYRTWMPSGVDVFSWCYSDSHLKCCSEKNSRTNFDKGDGSKSCPNIYEDFTTTVSSCPTSSCSQCYIDKVQKGSSRSKKKKMEGYNFQPKDSLEVLKKRRYYANHKIKARAKCEEIVSSRPSLEDKAQNCHTCCKTAPVKPATKTTQESSNLKTDKKTDRNYNKHVSLPNCDEMNNLIEKRLNDDAKEILTFGKPSDNSEEKRSDKKRKKEDSQKDQYPIDQGKGGTVNIKPCEIESDHITHDRKQRPGTFPCPTELHSVLKNSNINSGSIPPTSTFSPQDSEMSSRNYPLIQNTPSSMSVRTEQRYPPAPLNDSSKTFQPQYSVTSNVSKRSLEYTHVQRLSSRTKIISSSCDYNEFSQRQPVPCLYMPPNPMCGPRGQEQSQDFMRLHQVSSNSSNAIPSFYSQSLPPCLPSGPALPHRQSIQSSRMRAKFNINSYSESPDEYNFPKFQCGSARDPSEDLEMDKGCICTPKTPSPSPSVAPSPIAGNCCKGRIRTSQDYSIDNTPYPPPPLPRLGPLQQLYLPGFSNSSNMPGSNVVIPKQFQGCGPALPQRQQSDFKGCGPALPQRQQSEFLGCGPPAPQLQQSDFQGCGPPPQRHPGEFQGSGPPAQRPQNEFQGCGPPPQRQPPDFQGPPQRQPSDFQGCGPPPQRQQSGCGPPPQRQQSGCGPPPQRQQSGCGPPPQRQQSELQGCGPPTLRQQSDFQAHVPPPQRQQSGCGPPPQRQQSELQGCGPPPQRQQSEFQGCGPPTLRQQSDFQAHVPPPQRQQSEFQGCGPLPQRQQSEFQGCGPPPQRQQSEFQGCGPPPLRQSDFQAHVPPPQQQLSDFQNFGLAPQLPQRQQSEFQTCDSLSQRQQSDFQSQHETMYPVPIDAHLMRQDGFSISVLPYQNRGAAVPQSYNAYSSPLYQGTPVNTLGPLAPGCQAPPPQFTETPSNTPYKPSSLAASYAQATSPNPSSQNQQFVIRTQYGDLATEYANRGVGSPEHQHYHQAGQYYDSRDKSQYQDQETHKREYTDRSGSPQQRCCAGHQSHQSHQSNQSQPRGVPPLPPGMLLDLQRQHSQNMSKTKQFKLNEEPPYEYRHSPMERRTQSPSKTHLFPQPPRNYGTSMPHHQSTDSRNRQAYPGPISEPRSSSNVRKCQSPPRQQSRIYERFRSVGPEASPPKMIRSHRHSKASNVQTQSINISDSAYSGLVILQAPPSHKSTTSGLLKPLGACSIGGCFKGPKRNIPRSDNANQVVLPLKESIYSMSACSPVPSSTRISMKSASVQPSIDGYPPCQASPCEPAPCKPAPCEPAPCQPQSACESPEPDEPPGCRAPSSGEPPCTPSPCESPSPPPEFESQQPCPLCPPSQCPHCQPTPCTASRGPSMIVPPSLRGSPCPSPPRLQSVCKPPRQASVSKPPTRGPSSCKPPVRASSRPPSRGASSYKAPSRGASCTVPSVPPPCPPKPCPHTRSSSPAKPCPAKPCPAKPCPPPPCPHTRPSSPPPRPLSPPPPKLLSPPACPSPPPLSKAPPPCPHQPCPLCPPPTCPHCAPPPCVPTPEPPPAPPPPTPCPPTKPAHVSPPCSPPRPPPCPPKSSSPSPCPPPPCPPCPPPPCPPPPCAPAPCPPPPCAPAPCPPPPCAPAPCSPPPCASAPGSPPPCSPPPCASPSPPCTPPPASPPPPPPCPPTPPMCPPAPECPKKPTVCPPNPKIVLEKPKEKKCNRPPCNRVLPPAKCGEPRGCTKTGHQASKTAMCKNCNMAPCSKMASQPDLTTPSSKCCKNKMVSQPDLANKMSQTSQKYLAPCKSPITCVKSCPFKIKPVKKKKPKPKEKECIPDCANRDKGVPQPCESPPHSVLPPQCPVKCSARTKISGLHMKKLPSRRKTCASDCKAWSQVQCQEGTVTLNSVEQITIKMTHDNLSRRLSSECRALKPESGILKHARVDQPVVVSRGELITKSQTNTTATTKDNSIIQIVKSKSDSSVANTIEIDFKLRVIKGDRTTQIDLGNNDESNLKTKIGKMSPEVFVLNNTDQNENEPEEELSEESPQKNNINIKILIKNYKNKSEKKQINAKEIKLVEDFSKKISQKFHSVSTGLEGESDATQQYKDASNVFSVHRATIDLTNSCNLVGCCGSSLDSGLNRIDRVETTGTETECFAVEKNITVSPESISRLTRSSVGMNKGSSRDTKESSRDTVVGSVEKLSFTDDDEPSMDLCMKTSDYPTSDPCDDQTSDTDNKKSNDLDTDFYIKTSTDEQDTDWGKMMAEIPHNKSIASKKALLKKVFENGNYLKKPKNKSRIRRFKDILKSMLTSDSSEPDDMVVTHSELAKDIVYPSLKPNFFKNSDSLNNFFIDDSLKVTTICSEYKPTYPTVEKNSVCSVKTSDEWSEEEKDTQQHQGCVCTTLAARLNSKMCSGGGCCCQKKSVVNEEVTCDLTTDDYISITKSLDLVDVETQNSKQGGDASNFSTQCSIIASKAETLEVIETIHKIERTKDNKHVSKTMHALERNKLGITEDDNIIFLKKKTSKHNQERYKRSKQQSQSPRINKPADVLQLYETKKAVLEIYAEKTDDGEHMVAKLPKFVFIKESDIRNFDNITTSSYKIVTKKNVVMSSGR